MVTVGVRADDCFFINLLAGLFLPFTNDIRGRHIVAFVELLTQHIGFCIAGALLPSMAIFVFFAIIVAEIVSQ